MKKTILVITLSLACSLIAYAQKSGTRTSGEAGSQTSAAAAQAGKNIQLDSGTHIAGELQNSIDVRKAKVGDQVLLRTTQAIKSDGRTVVGKGSRLVGHITEVAQKGKGNSESRVGILFDRLEQGSLATPIAATISSVTSGRASAHTANDNSGFGTDLGSSGSARSSSSASSSAGGNGGLLGGVGSAVNSTTSTVGSVVGGTTSALGTTVDSTTNTVGNTTGGLGRSLGGIQISQSSSTSVDGSSTLSLQDGNLRLEKGTNFNLVLTQSVGAGATRNQ